MECIMFRWPMLQLSSLAGKISKDGKQP
uniref:Uncharacterized protein n=1 Tax=Arundo donax TaxID=35708 RepID=A0A0A9E4X5_ARUDO